MQHCVGLLYPTQHCSFLTHKSQILHVWKLKMSPQCISSDEPLKVNTSYIAILLPIKLFFFWRPQQCVCAISSSIRSCPIPYVTHMSSLSRTHTKLCLQPYMMLPTPALHPPAPHEEEDGEGHGEASRTGDMLPFPCGSATDSTPKTIPSLTPCTSQWCLFHLQTCCFAQSHGSNSAPKKQQADAASCRTSHLLVGCAAPSLPRLQSSQATSWVGQLSTSLLLRLC